MNSSIDAQTQLPPKTENETARILVTEDNAAFSQYLEWILKPYGYRLRFVENGSTAVQTVREFRPNLVLLDRMLPGCDGFQICHELRSAKGNIHLPIIIMSALNSDQDRYAAFEAGADDFLGKPLKKADLLWRIRTLLNRKSGKEESDRRSGILTVDPNGTIIHADSDAERALGAIHPLAGQLLSEVLPDQRGDKTELNFLQHMNPTECWQTALFWSPVSLPGGRGTAIIAETNAPKDWSHTVTEIQVRNVNGYRYLNSKFSRFHHQIRHKLLTPLNGIMGARHLLDGLPESQAGNSAIAEVNEILKSSADRLNEAINSILIFTESKKPQREPHNIYITHINELIETYKEVKNIKSLHLTTNLSVERYINSYLSEADWYFILEELIRNATTHNSDPVDIAINLELASEEIRLSVSDSGQSIPPDWLHLAWEPYSQLAESSNSGESKGMGLGLSIIKKLIINAGGTCNLSITNLGGLQVDLSVPRSYHRN